MKYKILTLIMALAVCSSLILSLCSFTTTPDDENATNYRSLVDFDADFVYHRTTTTINKYYYGTIPQFNSTKYSSNGVTTYGADYYIKETKELKYHTTTQSSNASFYDTPVDGCMYSGVGLSSDDANVGYFNGKFALSSPFTKDMIMDMELVLFDENGDVVDYSTKYISYQYWIAFPVGSGFDLHYEFMYYLGTSRLSSLLPDISAWLKFYELWDAVGIDDDTIVAYMDFTITDNVHPITNSVMGTNVYSGIYLIDKLYSDTYFDEDKTNNLTEFLDRVMSDGYDIGKSEGLDEGYDIGFGYGEDAGFKDGYAEGVEHGKINGFDIGYAEGYADGVDNAPKEWGSVGTFLVNVLGSFTSAEIFPGFTIGGVLGVIAGGLLLLMFLKMFAGG